jgi:hypothetical protein
MARSFNGSSDIAERSQDVSAYFSNTTGTVMAWCRPTGTSPSEAQSYTGRGIVAHNGGYWGIFRATVGGLDRIWAYNWDSNEDKVGFTYTVDEWVHVAWQHAGGNLSIYKNGVLQGTVASGTTQNFFGNMNVGGGYNGANKWFNGDVAQVLTYPTAITADEILAVAKGGNPLQLVTGRPSVYLPLFGDHSPEIDFSSNDRTFTLTGTSKAGTGPPIGPFSRWYQKARYAPPPVAAINLSGTAEGTSTMTGALLVSRRLGGTSAGSGALAGVLQVSRRLVGSSAGASVFTGTLRVSRNLAVTAAGSSGFAAEILVQRLLSASAAGQALVNAALTVARELSGTSTGVGTLTGAATVSRPLSGSCAGSAGLTGEMLVSRLMNGTAPSSAALAGALHVARDLAGTVVGTSGATGSLIVQRLLAGLSAGSSLAIGAIGSTVLLAGISAGSSVAAAELRVDRLLAAEALSLAVATGDLEVVRLLAGAAAGSATATGELVTFAERYLSYIAVLASIAASSGTIQVIGQSYGVLEEIATTSGSLEDAL